MNAADVMTTPVVTVRPDTPVRDAVRVMLQDRISGLPIVDKNGELRGIVTEGDFLRRAETGTERRRPRWLEWVIGPGLADEYIRAHGRTVADVMTSDIISVGPAAPLAEIVTLMERRGIKRVLVVRDGKLLGIVSRANLLRALAAIADDTRVSVHSIASDTVIRTKVLAEMQKQTWAPVGSVSVVVWDGCVHFWGTVTEERQRQALRVLAQSVPGVQAVREHLEIARPIPTFAA